MCSANGPHRPADFPTAWAPSIVRLGEGDSDTYIFKPRGLDVGKTYRVTFDSTGAIAIVDGLRLLQEGIPVRLETIMSSELLWFQAQQVGSSSAE
jgi:hypothetical protein